METNINHKVDGSLLALDFQLLKLSAFVDAIIILRIVLAHTPDHNLQDKER